MNMISKNFDMSVVILHYGDVFASLRETIRLMAEVDGVIDVNGG